MDISALVEPDDAGERKAGNTKPFACAMPGCTSAFARRSDLVRHHKIHTGDRQFVCTIDGCGKTFLQRTGLTVHSRTHTGEKPHCCETCQRAFADSSSLARHRRIHSNERLFSCQLCNKRYVRKPSLLQHVQKHDRNQDPESFDRAMRAASARRPKTNSRLNATTSSVNTNSFPKQESIPIPTTTMSDHVSSIHSEMDWNQHHQHQHPLPLPTLEDEDTRTVTVVVEDEKNHDYFQQQIQQQQIRQHQQQHHQPPLQPQHQQQRMSSQTIVSSTSPSNSIEQPGILPESAFADAELLNGISTVTRLSLPPLLSQPPSSLLPLPIPSPQLQFRRQ